VAAPHLLALVALGFDENPNVVPYRHQTPSSTRNLQRAQLLSLSLFISKDNVATTTPSPLERHVPAWHRHHVLDVVVTEVEPAVDAFVIHHRNAERRRSGQRRAHASYFVIDELGFVKGCLQAGFGDSHDAYDFPLVVRPAVVPVRKDYPVVG